MALTRENQWGHSGGKDQSYTFVKQSPENFLRLGREPLGGGKPRRTPLQLYCRDTMV